MAMANNINYFNILKKYVKKHGYAEASYTFKISPGHISNMLNHPTAYPISRRTMEKIRAAAVNEDTLVL